MRQKEILDRLKEYNPDAVIVDGFDDAIIGYSQMPPFCAVYDVEKCIAVLVEAGMTLEDSVEYFDYNVLGSYLGENSPIFVSL